MDTTATNKKMREIITEISQNTLVLRPGFQRNLVWTSKHKNNIIRTVLKGYPFPEIFIATMDCDVTTAASKVGIVDGQQRISTLYSYFKGTNDFKLESDIKPYVELSIEEQRAFLEYVVVVRDLGIIEDSEIKEVFRRLNSTNYSLNSMEINHAVYNGAFKTLCERLAENDFFEKNRIFTSLDIRRMNDSYYIASILATILQGYFNNDSKIDECFSLFNEVFEQEAEIESNFCYTLELLTRMDIKSKRILQKGDFFTLFVEMYHSKFVDKNEFDEEGLSAALKQFYDEVDGIATRDLDMIPNDPLTDAKEYKKNVIQGTNHRSARIARGEIIQKIISKYTK